MSVLGYINYCTILRELKRRRQEKEDERILRELDGLIAIARGKIE
jgi:hypothetical protein